METILPDTKPKTLLKSNSKKNKLAIVMDPLDRIHRDKDTSLCLIEAAGRRHWQTDHIAHNSLSICDNTVWGESCEIGVTRTAGGQLTIDLGRPRHRALEEFDAILMRQDPPVDMEFIHNCRLLSLVKRSATIVINDPDSLCLLNEKILSLYFPDFIVPSIISKDLNKIKGFIDEHQEAVIKPLNAMGGHAIVRLRAADRQLHTAIDKLSDHGSRSIMVQKVIPQWQQGDKRILIMGGQAVDQALLRVPPPGQLIANLAAGGQGQATTLTARERLICSQLGPFLVGQGILLAGIDVINGYLTEINITSPTGMREINRFFNIDLGMQFMDLVEQAIEQSQC